jgi:hypothetical protein
MPLAAPAERASARPQRGGERGGRVLQHGNGTEEGAGDDRHDEREEDNRAIDRDFAQTRKMRRRNRRQHMEAAVGEAEAEHAAERAERQALRHQLARDASRSRADRRADRQLLLARIGAHEQQVRDVRAGDEQHHADRAHQHPEDAPDIADEILLQRTQRRTKMRVVEHLDAESGERGEGLDGDGNEPRHVGGGAVDRGAWREARQRLIAEVAKKRLAPVEPKRQERRRVGVEESKRLREHADHFVGPAVDEDAPADGRRIAAESRSPVSVCENHRLRAAGRIVDAREYAAEQRFDTQDWQDAVSDVERRDLFGLGQARDAVGVAAPQSHVLKALRLFTVDEVEERRRPGALDIHARRSVIHRDELVRTRVRQRLQQYAVDDAEDGAVGADADAERQNDDAREHREPDQSAQYVLKLHGSRYAAR